MRGLGPVPPIPLGVTRGALEFPGGAWTWVFSNVALEVTLSPVGRAVRGPRGHPQGGTAAGAAARCILGQGALSPAFGVF